jgi:hypothetical protein
VAAERVEVGVLALERRMEAVFRSKLDGYPAEKPERKVLPLGLLG